MDISDRSLKFVQLKKKKNGLLITSYINKDIPEGIVKGGEIQRIQKLALILKEALKGVRGESLFGNEVVCSLPEERVFVRVIQLPKMKKGELARAIKWEVEAHIPMKANEIYLDWQILPDSGKLNNFNILIAAAPQELVDGHLLALKQSGLRSIAFEPESVAVVRALIAKNDSKPTIIVDLGQTGTNFVVFSNSTIRFTSHISISGQAFNKAIAKEMEVSSTKANQLKIKIGLNKTKKKGKVYKALLPVVNDLAKQIKEYIDFYHGQASQAKEIYGTIEQIILCGGDSLLIDLIPVLSQRLNLPIRMGNPLVNISLNGKKGSAFSNKGFKLFKKELLGYTTALGLALREAQ